MRGYRDGHAGVVGSPEAGRQPGQRQPPQHPGEAAIAGRRLIRTRADDPTTVIPTARQIVASIDPALPNLDGCGSANVRSERVRLARRPTAVTSRVVIFPSPIC